MVVLSSSGIGMAQFAPTKLKGDRVTARKRLDTAHRIKASSVRKTERPPGAAKRKMIGQNSMRADEYNSFEKQLARYRAAISRIEEFNFNSSQWKSFACIRARSDRPCNS
jgi:U3 small nucleolar ribonucleoprotein component